MSSETEDRTRLAEALDGLRRELALLRRRVDALEAREPGHPQAAAPAPLPPPPTPAEELSEELVLVIGAALAAYLGKRPHIRQIRLLGSPAWAQQGRVTVQASHALAVGHG